MLNHIRIYTDGACAGNQFKENFGGWGVVIIKDNQIVKKESGAARITTNNRMELFAIIKALEFIHHNESKSMPYRYEVFSDSAYIINCLHQKWYQKWQKNGWITSKNKPVKNKDLWKKLLALLGKTPIEFIKIKAHAGHQYNELADHLAVEAIAKFTKNT